jgi:hypothetical protein
MKKFNRFQFIFIPLLTLGFLFFTTEALRPEKKQVNPLKAGEEARGSWWMKQTAIHVDGRMSSLKSKKWWKKAIDLKPGESFILEEKGEAQDRMLVKIESYTAESGEKVEVLVWVIDDDGDESLKSGGDFHDDCYVYDLNRDGLVDILVDYADENGDGQADFMEIRLFERGQLVRAYFGYDFENIGEIFKFKTPMDLISEKFSQNLSGNKLYFKNVFNPLSGTWSPAETCPLASFDLNQDGLSDLVVRFNLQPSSSDTTRKQLPESFESWSREMSDLLIQSLELSFDVDRANNQEKPFHYDLGLNLDGRLKYDFEHHPLYSLKRRPPQEVCAIAYEKILEVLSSYRATKIGLSWKEYGDQSTTGDSVSRLSEGEGIGWVWERRPVSTSGQSFQKWNVRREVADGLTSQPELYYSELDQRVHLYGAEEGWLQIGNFAGLPRLAEIRYFDTDKNGFFDYREVYLTNSTRPVLVLKAKDEKAKKIGFDFRLLSDFYLNEVLPGVFDRNEKLLRAMKELYVYQPPAGLKEAMEKASLSERRYLQDVYCLFYFIDLRDHFLTLANQKLFQETIKEADGKFYGDLYPGLFQSPRHVGVSLKSDQAWKLARLITELEMAFAQAEVDEAINILNKIKDLRI